MSMKAKKPNTSCPFWSVKSLKCRLCNDGLFIPLDNHIEIYCTTVDYPQCLQYSLYMNSQEGQHQQKEDQYENRRRHRRIVTRHKVTLVKLLHSGEIISHHSTFAETLDISMGGMRVTMKSPLLNNTVVQFSFDDSFPESLQTGIGKIQWCNKQIDDNVYQAGLAFQGPHIIEAMGLFLGIHDKQL